MQHAANDTGAVMSGITALIGIPWDGSRTAMTDFGGAERV